MHLFSLSLIHTDHLSARACAAPTHSHCWARAVSAFIIPFPSPHFKPWHIRTSVLKNQTQNSKDRWGNPLSIARWKTNPNPFPSFQTLILVQNGCRCVLHSAASGPTAGSQWFVNWHRCKRVCTDTYAITSRQRPDETINKIPPQPQ